MGESELSFTQHTNKTYCLLIKKRLKSISNYSNYFPTMYTINHSPFLPN